MGHDPAGAGGFPNDPSMRAATFSWAMIDAVAPAPGNCSDRNVPTTLGSEPGILQFFVAAGVVGVEAGVGDELDGLRR